MTDQMPIATRPAVRVDTAGADTAPPIAPMIMPKQGLAREPGLMRRGFAALMARVVPGRSGFWRIG